jgi:DNA polymerase-3 subunit epsilon
MKVFSQEKPLAIVDIETTGASPVRDRVLEIAIIRIEQGKVVETLNTVLDPECSIPVTITGLTGISEKDMKAAPTFNDISKEISRLLDGAYFVAHNARFDHSFIKAEFARLGINFSKKRLCTVALSRELFPQYKRHDLSTIIDRFSFTCENRHRAYDDAKILGDFMSHCEKLHKQEKIEEAMQKVLKRVRVPASVPLQVIENLPENPGVYIFYGEDGEILYIGKSINIKKRVISHFGNDASSKQLRLASEVKDIEAITTAGELGALLLESHMIKKEQPLYNRLSRRTKKLVVVQEEMKNGYKHAILQTYNTEDLEASEKVLGIFRSQSQAKKALSDTSEAYKLCPRLLSLEKGSGPCFYSQLGRCYGACGGRESDVEYNSRFDTAFKKRKIRTWPFAGPIMITEPNIEEEGKGQVFIIDNWRLTGSFSYDEAGQSPFLESDYIFDHDSYKILVQYLKNNKKSVKSLSSNEAARLRNLTNSLETLME